MTESFKPANGPRNMVIQPEEYIGKTITFSDPDLEKNSSVIISKINRILGKGSFCDWVADVQIEIPDEKMVEKKTKSMAIKKYKENEEVEQQIQRSYNNFKILKKLNISTWDTYRINLSNRLVLMTLGCKNDEILLTTNDVNGPKKEFFKNNPIHKIENIDEFVLQLKDILHNLNKSMISLNADSWGFVFTANKDLKDVYSIRAVVADIDFLNSHTTEEEKHIPSKNLWSLILALKFMYPGTEEEIEEFKEDITIKVSQV